MHDFRCQDTVIGGAFVRGISGGERKRLCIGNEILLNPSLLFLDEPTSGLDSTTALRIVQMLHSIAEVLKLFRNFEIETLFLQNFLYKIYHQNDVAATIL